MTQQNTDRPVLTAMRFVAGAALLFGILVSQMPNERLSEIMQTIAAAEAGLDSGSIGYKIPSDATAIARADLHR